MTIRHWLLGQFMNVIIGALIVVLIVLAAAMILNLRIPPTPITGRVDRLWVQQDTNYVRVALPDGALRAWWAPANVWGVLDIGRNCTFLVKEDRRVESVSCEVGPKQ